MATGLSVTREGNIAELIIDQPRKRNAISYDMWSAIPAIVADVEADDSIKLLIVRGNGSHFSAGADISDSKHAAPCLPMPTPTTRPWSTPPRRCRSCANRRSP